MGAFIRGLGGSLISASIFFPGSVAGQTVVRIDANRPQQSFEGWGASLCWWAHGVGRWNAANVGNVVNLLTDPATGLGYNIFRYNIGGGDQPGHAHFRQYGDVPGYKPTEAGAYDWNADPYQRNVAARIVAAGRPIIWEAFSNSPPYWMTNSQCAAGNTDGSDNLRAAYFDDFADYLTEVVRHFRDFWGITFRSVTPFNEPAARWWISGNNQEGCGFLNNQHGMIKLMGNALRNKGLTATTLSAADENSITDAVSGFNRLDDSARAFMTQMNAHSYNGKNSRAAYAQLGAQYGKRIWQSESGPLVWPGGNQMDVSLWMADVIIRDIKEMKANAWLDWQPIDGGVWGSLTVNYSAQTAVPNKRFFMHANFSRFIRPGAQIIDSDRDSVMAALVPSTGNLVVVILNGTTASRNYSLDLSTFSSLPATASAYRTSETENLAALAALPLSGGRLAVTAVGRSINTYLIQVAVPIAIRPPEKMEEKSDRFKGVRVIPIWNTGFPWSGAMTDVKGRKAIRIFGMEKPAP